MSAPSRGKTDRTLRAGGVSGVGSHQPEEAGLQGSVAQFERTFTMKHLLVISAASVAVVALSANGTHAETNGNARWSTDAVSPQVAASDSQDAYTNLVGSYTFEDMSTLSVTRRGENLLRGEFRNPGGDLIAEILVEPDPAKPWRYFGSVFVRGVRQGDYEVEQFRSSYGLAPGFNFRATANGNHAGIPPLVQRTWAWRPGVKAMLEKTPGPWDTSMGVMTVRGEILIWGDIVSEDRSTGVQFAPSNTAGVFTGQAQWPVSYNGRSERVPRNLRLQVLGDGETMRLEIASAAGLPAISEIIRRSGSAPSSPVPAPPEEIPAPPPAPPATPETTPSPAPSPPVPPAPAPAPPAPAPAPPPAGGSLSDPSPRTMEAFSVRMDRALIDRTGSVDVSLTVRNESDEPQQVTDGIFRVLIYDADGLGIGMTEVHQGGEGPLTRFPSAVMVQPGEDLSIRYVLKPLTGGAPLSQLVVREDLAEPASFNIAGLSAPNAVAVVGPSGGGGFASLQNFDVRLDELKVQGNRTELFFTVRNTTSQIQQVSGEFEFTLTTPSGAQLANRREFGPARGPFRAAHDTIMLEPGADVHVRTWFEGRQTGTVTVTDWTITELLR